MHVSGISREENKPANDQIVNSLIYSSSVCPGHRTPGGEGPFPAPASGPGSTFEQPWPPV